MNGPTAEHEMNGEECSTCGEYTTEVVKVISETEVNTKCSNCGQEWTVRIVAQTVLSGSSDE